MAEQKKQLGNDRLRQGDIDGAIDAYTEAIELDGTNHIYYSNRSAAYCKQANYSLALADANRCIDIAPNWAKGFTRAGAAYEGLKELEKSKDAYDKAVNLGWKKPAPAASPPPSTSSSSSSTTATSSISALSGLSKAALFLRMFIVANFFLYVFPLTSSYGSFQRCLFASFGSYLIQIYIAHGKPERTSQYGQRVMTDWRAHYAMTALLFAFAGHPRMLVLIPHVLSEIGHVADYTVRYQPQIAAKLSPILDKYILPRMVGTTSDQWVVLGTRQKWESYNTSVLRLNASLEVAIGINLLVEMFTPYRNLMLLFGYWHFMRIRYMVSTEIKQVFTALDSKILSVVSRQAFIHNLYQKVRTFSASMVKTPTPEEAARAREQGIMGNLRNSCVIS